MVDNVVEPVRLLVGPPAPPWTAWLSRLTGVALLVVIVRWLQVYFGGVALSPVLIPGKGNDTGRLFNWHPILITLAFAIFMSEAILTYRAPLFARTTRPQRKRIHFACHSLAMLLAALGVAAAWQSHALKLPSPIPHLYSTHSWLGAATMALASLQYVVGCMAYLWPGWPLSHRLALSPLHRHLGMGVWVSGLSTMALGLQEKTTFMQMGKGLSGGALRGEAMVLPALAQLLLLALGLGVLYQHVPPPVPAKDAGGCGSGSGTCSHERVSLLHSGAAAHPPGAAYEEL